MTAQHILILLALICGLLSAFWEVAPWVDGNRLGRIGWLGLGFSLYMWSLLI